MDASSKFLPYLTSQCQRLRMDGKNLAEISSRSVAGPGEGRGEEVREQGGKEFRILFCCSQTFSLRQAFAAAPTLEVVRAGLKTEPEFITSQGCLLRSLPRSLYT